MGMTYEYDDEFCCSAIEPVIENQLVDTEGGNYTYQSTYVCHVHKRGFDEYTGFGRFQGIVEIAYDKALNRG